MNLPFHHMFGRWLSFFLQAFICKCYFLLTGLKLSVSFSLKTILFTTLNMSVSKNVRKNGVSRNKTRKNDDVLNDQWCSYIMYVFIFFLATEYCKIPLFYVM